MNAQTGDRIRAQLTTSIDGREIKWKEGGLLRTETGFLRACPPTFLERFATSRGRWPWEKQQREPGPRSLAISTYSSKWFC